MDLCYTVVMDKNHHIWQVWAQKLHHWGVSDLTASLLEASGALSILGAQMIYLIQPVTGGLFADNTLGQMAEMLDDSSQKQEFVALLREEAPIDA
jgi:hypothetical protein